jgi:predicted nucleic acid-binding protein
MEDRCRVPFVNPATTDLFLQAVPIQPFKRHTAKYEAHALTLGHTVVTDNEREFSRVKDLRIENWLR